MYRVLMIADVPGWAYDRRMLALKKHCPEDFQVKTGYYRDVARTSTGIGIAEKFDLVYLLDFTARETLMRQLGNTSIPIVYSWNAMANCRMERREQFFRVAKKGDDFFVIVNNRSGYDDLLASEKNICNISNGVDEEAFGCDVPIEQRVKRMIWYGSGNYRGTAKQDAKPSQKGYIDILIPLREKLEAENKWAVEYRVWLTPLAPGDSWNDQQMRHWYNSTAVVVCSSKYEGTPNFVLEGMACGCAIVTTRVGNALEFGEDGVNLIFSERNVDALAAAVNQAWEKKKQLSRGAVETMRKWTYGEPGNRANYFYQLFRRIIDDGAKSIEPFTYSDKHWSDI